MQWAGKRNRKGRAMGGMILGIRVGITVEKESGVKEGMIAMKVRLGLHYPHHPPKVVEITYI